MTEVLERAGGRSLVKHIALSDLLDDEYRQLERRVLALFGALSSQMQDAAIMPAAVGERKVVLATSIAETSLTIEGVRIVVDGGAARSMRFSPRTGLSRLETIRVSRSSADQRSGRAGRTAPGIAYRLWTPEEDVRLVEPP